MNTWKEYRKGLVDGIPIVVGYVPIAMAFGILAKNGSLPLVGAMLFSVCVYAGASQFMAIAMIGSGAGVAEIAFATFLVNLRHFLMSASLVQRLHSVTGILRPLLAFGITDEVFSVASLKGGKHAPQWLLGLETAAYGSWVGGTGLGYMMGSVLPQRLQDSLGIALYAMFLSLLIPAVKQHFGKGAVAVLAALIHFGLRMVPGLPDSWALIGAIVLGAWLGTVVNREPDAGESETGEVTL